MSDRVVSSRDWRRHDEAAPGSRWSAVVLLGLLIIALVSFLLWVLWPTTPPNVAVHLLGVPDYSTDLPGIPFVVEDQDLFQEATLPVTEDQLRKEQLNEPGAILNLSSTLNDFFERGDEQDIAIIYVSAHGVTQVTQDAETGEFVSLPYLLGTTSSSLRYTLNPVAELLQQLEDIKAETKLLLLDSAHLGQTVDLGMVANEFVFELEKAVAASEDENLWLIHSTGLLQVSHISYREKNSVFARAVQQAFETLGDTSLGTKNEHIFLADFYLEICKTCLAYAPRNSSYTQTPILMRGGTGLVVIDPSQESPDVAAAKKTLVFYRSIKKPKSDEDEEKKSNGDEDDSSDGDEKTSSISSPVSLPIALLPTRKLLPRRAAAFNRRSIGRSATRQDDEDAADTTADDEDGSSGSDEGAEEKQDDDAEQEPVDPLEELHQSEQLTDIQKQLNRVMLLRDQLASRSGSRNWTPIDFAPQLWDRVLFRLMRLDERAMFVSQESDRNAYDRFLKEVNGFESDLRDLLAVLESGSSYSSSQLQNQLRRFSQQEIKDLMSAWNQFCLEQSGQAKSSWEQGDQEIRDIVGSLRVHHDVLSRLKYYQLLYDELSHFINPGFDGQLIALVDEVRSRQPYLTKVEFGDEKLGFTSDRRTITNARDEIEAKEAQLIAAISKTFDDQVKGRVAFERTEYLIAERLAVAFLHSPLTPMVPTGPKTTLTRIEVFNFLETLRERTIPKGGDASASEHWATVGDFIGDGSIAWSGVKNRLLGRQRLLAIAGADDSSSSSIDVAIDTSQYASSVETILQSIRAESYQLQTQYEQLYSGRQASGEVSSSRLDGYPEPIRRRLVSSAVMPTSALLEMQGTIFSGEASMLPRLRFIARIGDEVVRFLDEYPPAVEMTTTTIDVAADLQVDNFQATTLEISVDEIDSSTFDIFYRKPNGEFSAEPLQQVGETFTIPVVDLETQREDLDKNTVRLEFQFRAKPGKNLVTLPEMHHQSVPALVISTIGLSDQAVRTKTRLLVKSPLPQFVDLVVRNAVTEVWEPSNETGGMNSRDDLERNAFPGKSPIEIVEIHPFTKRAAPYELLLVNRSGVPIQIRAELYQVKRPPRFPGWQYDAYPLLPGRVSNWNLRTPDPRLVDESTYELPDKDERFMPAATNDRKMVPFAVSQLVTLPAATAAFPSTEQVFGDSDDRPAAKLQFGQPINLPAAEEGEEPVSVPNEPQVDVDVSTGILCRLMIKGWDGDEVVEQLRWIEMTPALWREEDSYIDITSLEYNAATRRIEAVIEPNGFRKSPRQPSRLPWEFLKEIKVGWVDLDSERFPYERFDELAIFDKTAPISRYWEIPELGEDEEIRDWPVWFDVDGYPRLFHYQLEIGDKNAVGRNERDSIARCRITKLDVYEQADQEEPSYTVDFTEVQQDERWIADCDHLVVHYEMDGPLGGLRILKQDDLTRGEEEYIRTFTRDSIRQPENEKLYFLDRDIRYLATIGKTGDLEVLTEVQDLERRFEASQLGRNLPIPFVAEWNLPVEKEDDETIDSKIIGIDTRKPSTELFEFPGGAKRFELPANQSVTVRIRGLDKESGINDSGIELYKDLEKNNVGRFVFGEDKKLDVRPSVVIDNTEQGVKEWEWIIVPKDLKLKIGTHTLTARVKDKVGLFSDETPSIELRIGEEVQDQEAEGGEAGPKQFDVELEIFTQIGDIRRRLGSRDIKFELEGPTSADLEPAGEEGYDRILRRMKPGSYKIKASVQYNRRTYELETTRVIAEDEMRPRIRWRLVLPRK